MDSFFQDFGLEHLLVVFMVGVSLLLLALTFERLATFAWVRLSLGKARGVIDAARGADLAAARAQADGLRQPLKSVFCAGLDRATGAVMTAADVSRSAAAVAGSTVTGAASKVRGLTGVGDDAPAPTPTTKSTPAKAAAAKKSSAARTTTAKKSTPRKTTAKKAPTARKSLAKKAPAKRTTTAKKTTARTSAKSRS